MVSENSLSPKGQNAGRRVDLPEGRCPQVHPSVILVVDDDLQVSRLVTRLMEQDGYFVLSAADGQAGLEVSRQYAGSIALLITGVRMPRLNGPDLSAHLLVERPGIKVIYSINVDLSELFTPSFDLPFLTKPINGQTLRAKVGEILGTPRSLPFGQVPSGPRIEPGTERHRTTTLDADRPAGSDSRRDLFFG